MEPVTGALFASVRGEELGEVVRKGRIGDLDRDQARIYRSREYGGAGGVARVHFPGRVIPLQ
jgi:hypothetical protein